MRQSNKNFLLVILVFLIAFLMQSIRNDGLYLSEALPLILWYGIGLAGAALAGRAIATTN